MLCQATCSTIKLITAAAADAEAHQERPPPPVVTQCPPMYGGGHPHAAEPQDAASTARKLLARKLQMALSPSNSNKYLAVSHHITVP